MERKCSYLLTIYVCPLLIGFLSTISTTSALAVDSYYINTNNNININNNNNDGREADSTAYLANSNPAAYPFDRLVYSYYNNPNNIINNNDSSTLYFFNHSAAAGGVKDGARIHGGDSVLTSGPNQHHHESVDGSRAGIFCSTSLLQCLFLSLVLGLMIISTIIGNSFVIAAVILERNLQGVANYLIVSLAVADLTVAIMVMPIGAYQEVYHTWNLGGVLCDIWTSFDVLCCTASILHLVAIALDRYWAITNVHYGAKRTAKRIVTMIVCIWTLSTLIAVSPHLFGLSFDESKSKRCMLTNNFTYQLVSTLGAFYLPLIVMCIIYWKIFQSAKFRIRSKGGMTTSSIHRRKEEAKQARRRSPKHLPSAGDQLENKDGENGEAGDEKDGHNVATRFLIRTSRSLSFSSRKTPYSQKQSVASTTNSNSNNTSSKNNETSFSRNNLRQQSLRVVAADRTDDNRSARRKTTLELPSTVALNPPPSPSSPPPPNTILPTSNHSVTDTSTTKEHKDSENQDSTTAAPASSPNPSSPTHGHKSIKSIIKKNMFVFSHIALLQKARQAAERPFEDELYDNQNEDSDEEQKEERDEENYYSTRKASSRPSADIGKQKHPLNKSATASTTTTSRKHSSYDNTSSYLIISTTDNTNNNSNSKQNQFKKYLQDKRNNNNNNNKQQTSTMTTKKSNTFVFGLKEEDAETKAAAARKLSSVLTDRVGGRNYHRESEVSQKSGGWLQPDKSLAMYEDSAFNLASSTRASYAFSENDAEEGSMLDLDEQHQHASSSSTRINSSNPESSGGLAIAAAVAVSNSNRVKKISFNENEKSPNTEKVLTSSNKLKINNVINEFEPVPKSTQQRLNMIASISSQSRSSTTSTSNNDYSATKSTRDHTRDHTLSTTEALTEPSNAQMNRQTSTKMAGSNNSFRIEGTKTADLAKKRARIDIKRERKAAKTLGVIMTCFIVCWLPFFLMQTLFSICRDTDCYLSQLIVRVRLDTILTWTGYLNSLLNPVIYTIFSPDFRIAFAKILFGKYSSRNRHPRK